MKNDVLIQVHDLVKLYGTEVRALDKLNFTVQEGEFLAVMGPSGSGKTTLLNLLGALDRPTSGEIHVAGERLAAVRDPDRFRSRAIGFVFQLHNLIPTLTARENVEVPMQGGPLARRARQEKAEKLLAWVGLSQRANSLPAQLSGGERQRVAIARALANQPRLLLADEPTGNLDSNSKAEVVAVLRRLNQEQGMTVLIVTHDPTVARATDRIVVLRDGRIVRDERVRDPYHQDLHDFRFSALGRALLEGHVPESLQGLGMEALLPQLQQMLARA
ncbi:MAG: ABC transporter ATP-binding protein [Chloroflexi bacterium]|nr:ABC transporter ATP-binding protein [Chloroflexota bacterium]